MSSYLAYSYSICLSEKEQVEIDKKVKKTQEKFRRGFIKDAQISLSIHFVYSLMTAAAYAADSSPNPD